MKCLCFRVEDRLRGRVEELEDLVKQYEFQLRQQRSHHQQHSNDSHSGVGGGGATFSQMQVVTLGPIFVSDLSLYLYLSSKVFA